MVLHPPENRPEVPHDKDVPLRYALVDWCSLLVFLGVFTYLTTAFWGETYDDVFLAYQYARNIEAGHGFVFNIGEHFLGTPAPLFVLLLVGSHRLFTQLSIPEIGTLVSCAGLTLTAWLLYLIGRAHGQRLLGALIGLLAIFNPFSLLVLGGESPLYLALITGSFVAVSSRRFALTGVLLGLALMCRTEALIPVVVALGYVLWSTKRAPLVLMSALLVTIAPWISFAMWEFGSPLTNSFFAKVAQVQSGRKPFPFGFAAWLQSVFFGANPLLLCALIPAAFGGVSLVRTAKPPYRLLALWGFLQTVAYCVLPIPFYHWYVAHLGVFASILIGTGVFSLSSRVQRNLQAPTDRYGITDYPRHLVFHRLRAAVLVACTAATILGGVRATLAYDAEWPHAPANELYVRTGKWLKENSPPDSRVAYIEIGQIAFYSDRHIIDTLGLVTPEVASHVASGDWLWSMKRYQPDYIIYNPFFVKWPRSDLLLKESWFTEGFREEARLTSATYPFPLLIYKKVPG